MPNAYLRPRPSPRRLQLAVLADDAATRSAVTARFDVHADRVEVVDLTHPTVEVVVCCADRVLGREHPERVAMRHRRRAATHVYLLSDLGHDTVRDALLTGADHCLPRGATADDVLAVLDGGPSVPRHHRSVPTARLSPRELEVLELIATGLSNVEIADSLFLSINSVKTYIRSAYQKIGVTRRSQAVLWVLRPAHATPVQAQAGRVTR